MVGMDGQDEALPLSPDAMALQQQLLQRQLAQAAALRAGPGDHQHSSPMGALFHGIAGAGDAAIGGYREQQLNEQGQQLLQQQQAAEAPGQKLLLALKQRQLDTENADAAAKAAERERLASTTNTTATTAAQLLQKYMGPKFKVPPGTSAAEILGLLPNAEKAYAVDEGAKNRNFAKSQADQARQDAANEREIDKEMAIVNKQWDPSGARAGERGKNQARLNAADRLRKLGEDEKGNPRDLSPSQMVEVARTLDSLLTAGGQPTEGVTQALAAHTASGKLAELEQWLTAEPHGAGQQAFVAQALDTAKRESGAASDQLRQSFIDVLPGVPKLRASRKADLANMIKAQFPQFDPESIDWGTGLQKAAKPAATHYLISPDGKQRVPADANGNPLGPPEPNSG